MEIKRIVCGTVNCYIVATEHGSVLVDTGEERYGEKVYRACTGKNVRLLVLTHGHIDHVQNAADLAKRLQIPIAMSKKDLNLLKDQLSQPLEGIGLLGKGLAAISKRKMAQERVKPFAPDIFLHQGDTLEAYGVPAVLLELPGHTEGSIALDVSGHSVIVGDTLMHMPFPEISHLYGDKTKLQESAGRIAALGDRTIYFGHGAPAANRDWLR